MTFNFIEKQSLENLLLDLELTKLAQIPANPTAILDLAKKLVDSFTTSALTADKPDTEVFLKDITSLDNLFAFLNTNGMRYDTKKIAIEATPAETGMNVYKGAEFSELSDQDKALYANYPETNPKYHVYKDGLIHYLQDLKLKGGELGASKNEINSLRTEAQNALKIHVPQLAARPVGEPSKEQSEQAGTAQPSSYTLVDWKPGQPMSPQQKEALKSLALASPLSQDRIDFERIRGFLETYQKLDPSPAVMPSINNALQAVTNITQYYHIPTQLTNVHVRDIAESVIANTPGPPQQKAGAPAQYLQFLSLLLSEVGNVLGALSSKYGSLPEMKQDINTQTAYYNYNRASISAWQTELPDALKSIRGT